MKKTIKNFTKEELLEKLKRCYTALVEDGEILWAGKIIDNDDDFKQAVKEAIKKATKAKVTMRNVETMMRKVRTEFKHNLVDNYRKAKTHIAELKHTTLKLEKQIKNLTARCEQLEALPKNSIYEITDEDKDLLIEIENVLCMRSRQIWGVTHKKEIKGGGDITPYKTGYNRMFDYLDLVARIIG